MTTTTPTYTPVRSRRAVQTATVIVALISTSSAYLAMCSFGRDALGMSPAVAWSTAGVLEMSLVTVALLAREAARDARPTGTLLTLTWSLSGLSGLFAGWHELHTGHSTAAAAFRFAVPVLAALLWHLALLGDQHLATGRTWASARTAATMHKMLLATEAVVRARQDDNGSTASTARLARATSAARRARAKALRTVPPGDMRDQVATWTDALAAVSDATEAVTCLYVRDTARVTNLLAPPADVAPPSTATSDTDLPAGATDSPKQAAPSSPRKTARPSKGAQKRRVDPEQVAALRAEGMEIAEIAAQLKVSLRTVYRAQARHSGVPTAQGVAAAAARHGMRVLPDPLPPVAAALPPEPSASLPPALMPGSGQGVTAPGTPSGAERHHRDLLPVLVDA